ncbi:hypothetical protein BVY04_03225 [bacterium M21]|nr:hypothetical protein BVY04_03225 [bacterium M21]
MTTPESDIADTIKAEIMAGRNIDAIKMIREFTGLDLRSAKDICDHCQANNCTDLEEMLAGGAKEPVSLSQEAGQRIDEMLFAGRKIDAIKALRSETGLGLKEAKDKIEERSEVLRKEHPDRMPKPGGGCGSVSGGEELPD